MLQICLFMVTATWTQGEDAVKDGADDVQLRIAWQYRRYLKDQERRGGGQPGTAVSSSGSSGSSGGSGGSTGRRCAR